jgi:hypothetical protein
MLRGTSGDRFGGGERGVTLVLFALVLTALLFVVAIVIDLGNVRNTRQDTKRVADLATAAGLTSLAPDGKPRPWVGACEALTYLQANEPSITFTVTFWDGLGPDGGNSVAPPCPAVADEDEDDLCVADDKTTWAWIRAVSSDRVVDIRSGYETGLASGFAEDQTIYAGDDSEHGGCDQLAVITGASDSAFFGGIGGVTDYESVGRSVGRVKIGNAGPVAVALVLLEQFDCQALAFSGGGGVGAVSVRGTGNRPGIIHSDSEGSGDGCPGRPVIEGKQNNGPRVRALSSPADPGIHGVISTYHQLQGGSNAANWTRNRTSNNTDVWACDLDAGTAGPDPCDTAPTGGARVTRTPADDRYLSALTTLRQSANSVFAQIAADTLPAEWVRYRSLGFSCNPTGVGIPRTVEAAEVPTGKLYVDCPGSGLQLSNNHSLTIESGITEVAFQGPVTLSGGGGTAGTLDIVSPRRVLINDAKPPHKDVALDIGGSLRINRAGEPSCSARHTAAPGEVSEVVIRTGSMETGNNANLSLCSTFVHLMGDSVSAAPVDVASGTYPAPYSNSQNGTFSVGGGGSVDWTAPNTTSGEPVAGGYLFEDLAVWTEAQSSSTISGGGAMVLKGIFVLPNAGPDSGSGGLIITGTSDGNIDLDAQLWTRKFHHNGNAQLRMRANPADSILLPFLADISLVR